jgi:hypothetical protein
MKTGSQILTIMAAILLLSTSSARAAGQETTAAPVDSAIAASPLVDGTAAAKPAEIPAAAGNVEKPAAVDESPTITMKIPLFSPAFANVPVAEVNEESITVDELMAAIGALHMGVEEQKTTARKSYSEILNRLINIRLIIQEAKKIELDQMQQIKDLVSQFERATLREILFSQQTRDVKVDEKEVDKLYRERIKEWKITTLRFTKEADAKKMQQELKEGGSFDLLLEKAVKDDLAQGGKELVFLHAAGANPLIAKALDGIKPGSISGIVPVDTGFALFRLEEVVFPENAETLKQARKAILGKTEQQALTAYRAELFKKYVKINAKLLKKLDFEAPKPGFAKMLDDKRVVAQIKGDTPVTVADLAQAINEKFFHGVAGPIKEKKVNELKSELLNNVIAKKIIMREALTKGIDKNPVFLEKVKDYKETVIFGVFVENIVRREVRLTENELKAYYREHVKETEYTYPGMVRINALVFKSLENAQACVDKMRNGVDFKWLKDSAEGQVADDAPDLLKFDGNLVVTTSLPEGLRKILTGVHSNDYRLYADSAKHYYALQIKDYIPEREMSYEEAKDIVKRKVYDENLKKILDDWTKKLREGSDVKIYADFGEIR